MTIGLKSADRAHPRQLVTAAGTDQSSWPVLLRAVRLNRAVTSRATVVAPRQHLTGDATESTNRSEPCERRWPPDIRTHEALPSLRRRCYGDDSLEGRARETGRLVWHAAMTSAAC